MPLSHKKRGRREVMKLWLIQWVLPPKSSRSFFSFFPQAFRLSSTPSALSFSGLDSCSTYGKNSSTLMAPSSKRNAGAVSLLLLGQVLYLLTVVDIVYLPSSRTGRKPFMRIKLTEKTELPQHWGIGGYRIRYACHLSFFREAERSMRSWGRHVLTRLSIGLFWLFRDPSLKSLQIDS